MLGMLLLGTMLMLGQGNEGPVAEPLAFGGGGTGVLSLYGPVHVDTLADQGLRLTDIPSMPNCQGERYIGRFENRPLISSAAMPHMVVTTECTPERCGYLIDDGGGRMTWHPPYEASLPTPLPRAVFFGTDNGRWSVPSHD